MLFRSTFQKLFGYYGSKGIVLNDKTFIKNLGLRNEEGQFNLLAQLLSDDSHFPLRVSIFEGKTKGTNLFSVREFGNNCLLYSLDELLRYGDVLNIIQADETDRVVERKEVPLFDNKAFREAIINAVLHNKWTEGNEPMISIFSDRIEILSRGSLPPAQTMEGFYLGESVPVNCGSNVALKSGNINDIYRVIAINNEKALCMKEDEQAEWNIADLMLNVIPMQLNWLRVMILKSVTMELRNY